MGDIEVEPVAYEVRRDGIAVQVVFDRDRWHVRDRDYLLLFDTRADTLEEAIDLATQMVDVLKESTELQRRGREVAGAWNDRAAALKDLAEPALDAVVGGDG